MRHSCKANDAGHTLYRWTDGEGQEWACCAYDHGPFCRLCVPVKDDMLRATLLAVEQGKLQVFMGPDGGFEAKGPSDAG